LSLLFTPRCHKQELALPGTLIAFGFPDEAKRGLLRDESGAIFMARLRKCFAQLILVESKTKHRSDLDLVKAHK